MQLYPPKIEDKLEVGQIRELIKAKCYGDKARAMVDAAHPGNDYKILQGHLAQTREAMAILEHPDRPPMQFEESGDLLRKLNTEGSLIGADDFRILMTAFEHVYSWTRFLKDNREEFPSLKQEALGFISDVQLARRIDSFVDEKGEVRTNATPELREIRGAIIQAEKKVRNAIRSILDRVKKEHYTEEDSEITIRNGRLVIPIKAEFKRNVAGFVHDESSTGQTVFMEPSEVLPLNNEVRELHYQEQREVKRILSRLAQDVRDQLPDLEKGARFLAHMDLLMAKAQWGKENGAAVPTVTKSPSVSLINAVHPNLKAHNDRLGKDTIPLNLELNASDHRVLVISGPNAGGKSVALKTTGLLQYMLQCAFPVTADENSVFGVFQNIFIDIGDSQSLENDLSTYSSRLTAMNYFLKYANKRTLILIDEFGTGTEPQYGGAIAEAILGRLSTAGTFGVITTHYTNIKKLADRSPGMSNGAMRFDTRKLEPLYSLEVGKPGSSFALEIARKTGLEKSLLDEARDLVGHSQVDFDKLLTELEHEKAHVEQRSVELKGREKEVKQLKRDYEALKAMIDEEKKKVIRNAKDDAKRIVAEANKRIERVIREIRESQADKAKTKQLREEIKELDKSLDSQKQALNPVPPDELKVGDKVTLTGQDGVGEILEMKKDEAKVSFGMITSFVSVHRLRKVSKKQARKEDRRKMKGVDRQQKIQGFSTELDVRGKRAEEVIPEVDRFLNDAILLGQDRLRILHGKGHGILREIVRNHLQADPNVISVADEHVELGGSGITLVNLK